MDVKRISENLELGAVRPSHVNIHARITVLKKVFNITIVSARPMSMKALLKSIRNRLISLSVKKIFFII